MLQAKPQPQATSQFNSQQDVPVDKVVMTSSAGSDSPAQLPTMLQPTSVLVKTAAAGSALKPRRCDSTRAHQGERKKGRIHLAKKLTNFDTNL